MNIISSILALVLLSGCSFIPGYTRPTPPVPLGWSGEVGNLDSKTVGEIGWKEFFKESRLSELITLALENNRDLRIAVLNVEKVRSQYRILDYALLPNINGYASDTRKREYSSGETATTDKYEVGVTSVWEVDLFGRIRTYKQQVLEQYFATQQAQRAAYMSLVSEVALQYLNERAIAQQLKLSNETLKAVEAYYALIKSSYEAGNTSELDLRSAEAQVQAAKVSIANYERLHAQAQDALVFVVGSSLPADLPLPQSFEEQRLLADLPAGLVSSLLERRPDIAQAEHQLKAANANIGAARAAFFPRITLTGSAGLSSAELSDLFTGGARVWSFSPKIDIPIFNRETNHANLNVAHVSKRIEVAQYERTIQKAFREVSDALAARSAFNKQLEAQAALVKAQQQRFDLADLRYRNGVESYLTVLSAQQDLYSAQQGQILSQFNRLANLIALYKALGGGWQE